jgi:CheY-like chemotaxis protein
MGHATRCRRKGMAAPVLQRTVVMQTPSANEARKRTLIGVRVLVVDDDRDTLELECLVLKSEGATVLCVTSVRETLEALEFFQPHLVITDFSMPGEDGLSLIHRIRADEDPHTAEVPIAVVTATHDPETQAALLEAGAAEVLEKPVVPGQLIRTVMRHAARVL